MSPTVGTGKNAKKFPYTPKGEAAAKMEAKKTGQKLEVKASVKKKMPKGMKGY